MGLQPRTCKPGNMKMMQSDSIIALDVSKDRLDGLDTQTGELF